MIATLAGIPIVRGSVRIPKWGAWSANVQIAGEHAIGGAVTLEMGHERFSGTVVRGGPVGSSGRSEFLVVAGAGMWGRTIPALGYRSAFGVKRSTVAADAANAAGERLASESDARIGPSFASKEGPASDVLDALSPDWYVDPAGVTHLAARGVSTYAGTASVIEEHPSRGVVVLSALDIRGMVPGAQVQIPRGLVTISSVRHDLTQSELRSTIFTLDASSPGDRFWEAVARIVRRVTSRMWLFGTYEYTVRGSSGGYLDLTPTDRSLPRLTNVIAHVGVPGGLVDVENGSRVFVSFVDGDPTRAFVSHYTGPEGSGFLPATAGLDAHGTIELGGATGRMLRSGDKITIAGVQPGPGVTGVIVTLDASLVAPGPGPTGFSRVKG